MKAELTVVLSLPPKELSPNARPHWRAKAKATKAYRNEARVAALQAMSGLPKHWHHFDKGKTFVTFYKPTFRRTDPDNLLSSLKAAFDGLVDAGLLTDDRALAHAPVHQLKSKTNPRCEIYLELER